MAEAGRPEPDFTPTGAAIADRKILLACEGRMMDRRLYSYGLSLAGRLGRGLVSACIADGRCRLSVEAKAGPLGRPPRRGLEERIAVEGFFSAVQRLCAGTLRIDFAILKGRSPAEPGFRPDVPFFIFN